jgi:hypothetical protein
MHIGMYFLHISKLAQNILNCFKFRLINDTWPSAVLT